MNLVGVNINDFGIIYIYSEPSPPSFASAAAATAVEQGNDDSLSGDLRNYRKYMWNEIIK